jgi:threonine dehydrogenase-like Zn-dependent dehydrogenase
MHKPPLLTCSSNPTASTFSRIVRAGCAAALAMMTVGAAPASAAPLRGSAPASPLVLAPQAGAVPTPEVCFATIDGINVYSSVNANALQQAVDAAAPGATVKVAGLCAGVQNRASTNQSVYISKTLTLEGGYSPSNWIVSDPMNNSTVIDAQAVGRLIFATAPVTLSQLTLQNGSAGVGNDGGAVFVAPAATAITISATQILSSTAGRSGGGIAISGTTASRVSAVFIDTTLRANSAVTNGGGIVASTNTTVTLNNAQVITNSAGQVGGGAFLDGRVEDSGSTFMRNYAAGSAVNRGGGGLYARSATLTNTQFLTNTATHSGGGLIMLDELVMNGGLFQGNQAFRAGGLYGQRNNWTLTGTQFIANSAMGNGGGAAYFNNSGGTQFVTLNNVWVERNTSDNFAGGLFINSPNTTFINGSTFLSNTAPNVGAISTGSGAANGMLLIYGNRFEGNQSTAQAAGAVQSSRPASTVISKTAFLRNTAATDAGAVQVTSGRAEFVNNLFAGNTAGSNLGAAAWLSSTGVFTLWHNTFAGAAPNAGSAVHVVNGNTQLRNNILASYTTGINVVAGSSSEDNNLFDNVTTPRAGIAAGANSVTGAASFNAPASDDFKFTPSSQAIDMGASLGVNEDFFGNPRPQQAAPDAGYFESPFVPLLACNAEINGDNVTDFSSNNAQAVRDAVAAVAVDGTVKVAGTCAGAVAQSGSTQVVLITQTLTLEGGYTATNWLASSDPIANPSTLDALAGGRVIYATVPVTVTNLTVQNGNTNESGGGGFFGSTVTLTGTRFISNTAAQPGGGARVQGVATLNGGLFENNTASQGGGLFANSTLALTKTQFISNTAVVEGGGARVNGAAMLNGGVFQNNTSEDGGGAWFGSSVVLSGTIFLSNTAPYEGGGARVAGAATIHGGRFENNRSTNSSGGIGGGGGLFAESTLTLTGTVFISNTAVYAGGGAHVNGTATLTGGRFENNRSIESFGGGLLAASTLTLTGTTFLSNTAAASGGGAAAFGAATLNGGWFENNISASGGGGLLAGNTLD